MAMPDEHRREIAASQRSASKRARKSRSRGLRTRTGCLTCRQRHLKCDEQGRSILSLRLGQPANKIRKNPFVGLAPQVVGLASIASDWVISHKPRSSPNGGRSGECQTGDLEVSNVSVPPDLPLVSRNGPAAESTATTGQISPGGSLAYSPGTSELLTAGGASTKWLDLLATDAAQADSTFSLVPSPLQDFIDREQGPVSSNALHARLESLTNTSAKSEYAWQEISDIVLQDHEAVLFRKFAEHISLWLDLLDPQRHFSTYATKLALRNVGLMKAILALASRHEAMRNTTQLSARVGRDPESSIAHTQAIRYYYETLHYVQTALTYTTYALSEEILATAVIISTYEMFDESNSNWQRHLKGVFRIQRSQTVTGESGGIRQAVWWAWLRQDTWAAFRERRPCFSFWIPSKTYSDLSKYELADHAIFLLSKAVNYSALGNMNPYGNPESLDQETIRRRSAAASGLLAGLEEWKTYLEPELRPLPCPHIGMEGTKTTFAPVWIHPPNFAVALMVYHFSKILIALHRPAETGFAYHLKTQRALSESVAVIVGIAMALNDQGCQIITAQCLFGAGLCVHEPDQRTTVLSLITRCHEETGWPLSTMREDLVSEWMRVDQDADT